MAKMRLYFCPIQ